MLPVRKRKPLSRAAAFAIEQLEQRCLLSSPYGPGETIEAEDFVNTSGDVEIDAVPGASGGAAVTQWMAGHWLEYAITLPQAGEYTFKLREGSGSGFNVTVDGHPTSGAPSQPVDVGQGWSEASGGGIQLSAGLHAVRVTASKVPAGGFAMLDALSFTPGPLSLDPTFGLGGVISDVDSVVAVQDDGKYITFNGDGPTVTLTRHNGDGSIDPTFGQSPVVPTSGFGSFRVLPDGTYMVSDYGIPQRYPPGTNVYRFNHDGSLDVSFGTGGLLSTGGPAFTIESQTGRILILGPDSGTVFRIDRFSSEGVPDNSFEPTFDVSGVIKAQYGDPDPGIHLIAPLGIATRPDGRIVTGYWIESRPMGNLLLPYRYFLFVQFNPDGSLDTSFGTGGYSTYEFSRQDSDYAIKMQLQPDGSIAAMWASVDDTGIVDYFDAQGTLFGSTWVGGTGKDFAIGPDGRSIGIGTETFAEPEYVTIEREDDFGAPDYGSDPLFKVPLPAPLLNDGQSLAITIQDDGKIDLLARIRSNGVWQAALFRFLGDAHGNYSFHGNPADATEPVQIEDFDRGADGAAYHDSDPANLGGAYRASGVDVGYTDDNGPAIGVGYTEPGEWLNYTVNVPSDGVYAMHVRVASDGQGGTFHLELDGQDITGQMQVPDTGSWSDWTTISSPLVRISAGNHVLRLVMDSAGSNGAIGNLNYFQLTAAAAYPPDQTIEAEDFSASGGGVEVGSVNGASGGKAVVNMQEGEWTEYPIEVPQDGEYAVELAVGADSAGMDFSLMVDGKPFYPNFIRTNAAMPPDAWIISNAGGIQLAAGEHVLRVEKVDYESGNRGATVDWLRFFRGPLSLDATFGDAGFLSISNHRPVAVQDDGKYLAFNDQGTQVQLERYNADGSLDTTFGHSATVPTAGFNSFSMLPNGKYLMPGSIRISSSIFRSVLYQFLPDGSLDTTFGDGGMLDGSEYAVQPKDGKIVMEGAASDTVVQLRRYTADGAPDPSFEASFDVTGLVKPAYGDPDPGTHIIQPIGVGVRPDGRIVAGYWVEAQLPSFSGFPHRYFLIIQFNADGSLDQSFADKGYILSQFSEQDDDYALKMELQPNGDVAAMWASLYDDGILVYFDSDGNPLGGTVTGGIGQDFAVGPDGLAIGIGNELGSEPVRIAREGAWSLSGYNDLGIGFDPLFHAPLPDSLETGYAYASAVTVEDDGKVVLVGRGDTPIPGIYGLFRFEGDAHGSYPFYGDPADPTGVIQVEDFDRGAEGVAYHDTDPANQAGAYRTTGVDVGYTDDSGPAIGVGYTEPGEWLNYTVSVGAGLYHFDVRVASANPGGAFHFEADGVDITGPMQVPDTGSWSDWTTIQSPLVHLTTGVHVLRLVMDSAGPDGSIGNFDYFQLTVPPPAGTGLQGTYYNNDYSNSLSRLDPTIDFDWGAGSPAPGIDTDLFTVSWRGSIVAPRAGTYTFYTQSDDGARLSIAESGVIDNWVPQPLTEASGTVDLEAGRKYDIDLMHFERYGDAIIRLLWSGPETPKQIIPAANLYPPDSLPDLDLDPTFGQQGIVMADVPNYQTALVTTVQTDGKILVAGSGFSYHTPFYGGEDVQDFEVRRYNPDGTLDTTFANQGIKLFGANPEDYSDVPSQIVTGPQGQVTVVGSAVLYRVIDRDAFTFRDYPKMGVMDTQVAYLSDGTLLVAGIDRDGHMSVSRDGGPQHPLAFGDAGYAIVSFADLIPGAKTSLEAVDGIFVRPDDTIIVAGKTQAQTDSQSPAQVYFAIVALTPDGQLNTSFGDGGRKIIPAAPLGDGLPFHGGQFATMPDGGWIDSAGTFVARFNSDGTLDTSFGRGGRLDISEHLTQIIDIATAADGQVAISGSRRPAGDEGSSAVRLVDLNSDGTLNFAFGSNGQALLWLSPVQGFGNIAFEDPEHLLFPGHYSTADQQWFALARFIIGPGHQ